MVVIAVGLTWLSRQSPLTQWGYAQAWYDQRQCRRITLPAETVVFQQCLTAEEAAGMVAGGKYVALPTWPTAYYPPSSVALKAPDCFLRGSGRSWQPALIFLHELTTPDGQKRLVVVPTCTALNPNDQFDPLYPPNVKLDPFSKSIAAWGQTPVSGQAEFLFISRRLTREPHRLKMFAGQVDPRDGSRFTIGYEWDGQPGVIDGYLDNAGRVILSFRDGPAKEEPERP